MQLHGGEAERVQDVGEVELRTDCANPDRHEAGV
jgi:hypothetical protein